MWGNEGLLWVWIFLSNSWCVCVMSWKTWSIGFCLFSIEVSFSFLQWAGKSKQEGTKVDAWFWLTWCKGGTRTIFPHIISGLKLLQTLLLSLGKTLKVPEWVRRHQVCAAVCLWSFSLVLYTWLLMSCSPLGPEERRAKYHFQRKPLHEFGNGLFSSYLCIIACMLCVMIFVCPLYVFFPFLLIGLCLVEHSRGIDRWGDIDRWRESRGCCLPRLQQGFWHCLP